MFEVLNVSLAAISICDRIRDIGGTARLVVDSTNVESIVSLEESYLILASTQYIGWCQLLPLPLTVMGVTLLARGCRAEPAAKAVSGRIAAMFFMMEILI